MVEYCLKNVRSQSFFCSAFSCSRTREHSEFGHFSRNANEVINLQFRFSIVFLRKQILKSISAILAICQLTTVAKSHALSFVYDFLAKCFGYRKISLTRTSLDKVDKEEIILLYMETNEKLSDTFTQLTNQIIELVKTLSRMEQQQANYNCSNEVFLTKEQLNQNVSAGKFQNIPGVNALRLWGLHL